MTYKPENDWKKCEKCGQVVPPLNLFLCQGRMMCDGCFMTITDGNTKFIDESQYPRRHRSE